jgi:hypothetical protein
MDQLIHSLAQALESSVRQNLRTPQTRVADRFSLTTRSK